MSDLAWRQKIISEVSVEVTRRCGPDTYRACPFWAALTINRLRREGVRAIVQAGTAYWPRRPRGYSGGGGTHFGFEWEPGNKETLKRIASGVLPEIHVWCAVPKTNDLIDLTTRYWSGHCRSVGDEWTAAEPPQYFWDNPSRLPDGAIYRPEATAIVYAEHILHELELL